MSVQVNTSKNYHATINAISLLANLQTLTLLLIKVGRGDYVENLETSLFIVQYLRKCQVVQWGEINDIMKIVEVLSILERQFSRVVIYGLEIVELYDANMTTLWNSLHQLRMTKQIEFSIEINTGPEVEVPIGRLAAVAMEHNSMCSKWWHPAHDSSSSEESSSNPAPL